MDERQARRPRLLIVTEDQEDRLAFSALVAAWRNHAEVPRADLAARLGVTAAYLRMVETGHKVPAAETTQALLTALGATVRSASDPDAHTTLAVASPDSSMTYELKFSSRIKARRSTSRAKSEEIPNRELTSVLPAPSPTTSRGQLKHPGRSGGRSTSQPSEADPDLQFALAVRLLSISSPESIREVVELLERKRRTPSLEAGPPC